MSSILKVKDKDGNWIDINVIKGEDGKSAYEQAKEGGYTGTEVEFIALLAGLNSSDDAHYTDFNNPHKVTKEQVGLGAISLDYGTVIGKGAQTYGGGTSIGENAQTTSGVAIGDGADAEGGVAIGDGAVTYDGIQLGRGTITDGGLKVGSYKLMDAKGNVPVDRLANASKIATGSYTGANKHGVNNPLSLTFPFVPKVVFIIPNAKAASMPFAWVYGSSIGLTAYNNSQIFASNLTWDGNTLTWYTSDGYPSYQHNNSNTTYYWVAIG